MKIHKRSIIAGLLVGILLLAATWYFTRPQGTVEFALAPSEVKLEIDNKTIDIHHKQTIKLSPGTYAATFSREGFANINESVMVVGGQTNRIVIALTPQTDAAKELIKSSEESQKVVAEYKKTRIQKLVATLPISGVGYRMTACESIRNPDSNDKAICIAIDSKNAEQAALNELRRIGYDPNSLELLIGNDTMKTLIKTDSFTVDYYTNVNTEHSEKPALFITPLNVPFVPFNEPNNPQLEGIKTDALAAIKAEGYNLEKFDIFYSNIYLSRYNSHANDASEHAMPPITP